MPFDRNGLQVLDRAECIELLRGARLGRIATTFRALPVVVPVNYALVDDDVVFRTGSGTKLAAAVTNAVVAFEVDAVDEDALEGWSVLVTGTAALVSRPDELEALAGRLPVTWLPTAPTRYVRIRTEMISGRRIVAGVVSAQAGALA